MMLFLDLKIMTARRTYKLLSKYYIIICIQKQYTILRNKINCGVVDNGTMVKIRVGKYLWWRFQCWLA
jgi:hypothetical protein